MISSQYNILISDISFYFHRLPKKKVRAFHRMLFHDFTWLIAKILLQKKKFYFKWLMQYLCNNSFCYRFFSFLDVDLLCYIKVQNGYYCFHFLGAILHTSCFFIWISTRFLTDVISHLRSYHMKYWWFC